MQEFPEHCQHRTPLSRPGLMTPGWYGLHSATIAPAAAPSSPPARSIVALLREKVGIEVFGMRSVRPTMVLRTPEVTVADVVGLLPPVATVVPCTAADVAPSTAAAPVSVASSHPPKPPSRRRGDRCVSAPVHVHVHVCVRQTEREGERE